MDLWRNVPGDRQLAIISCGHGVSKCFDKRLWFLEFAGELDAFPSCLFCSLRGILHCSDLDVSTFAIFSPQPVNDQGLRSKLAKGIENTCQILRTISTRIMLSPSPLWARIADGFCFDEYRIFLADFFNSCEYWNA